MVFKEDSSCEGGTQRTWGVSTVACVWVCGGGTFIQTILKMFTMSQVKNLMLQSIT